MEFILILVAYLLGSIPTGYVLGSRAGVDVRKAGSGNVGATNVARVVGKRHGLLTLIGDTAKGLIPVLLAGQLNSTTEVIALVAVAAFLGHLYPVFLKFHGGKGVATALGVLLGLAPLATVVLIAIFVLIVVTSRLVSLSSMIAAALAPLALWWFSYPPVLVGASALLAVMIILRHRGNIQRLLAGTEPKFGS
ncbi:MAG TPA: glycerol-3-phosphate 1-O-acyltransferase PlsY [Candidatus Udaeobacter sp.]|nr:glycerol-3-phosphate 1-O-acyltransferase PlsY [Candidatus Udaeobacter sp.]